MNLSARAYHRVLKLARTIADLAGSERIQPAHIAMSIFDRPRSSIGRGGWSEFRLVVSMLCLQLSVNMLEWLHNTEFPEERMEQVLVREYRSRWQAVSEVEAAEQQRATVEDRWARLNAILQMAVTLGLDLCAHDEEEAVVWQRWARLKAGLT